MTELITIIISLLAVIFLSRANGVKSEQVKVARKRDEVVKKTQINAEVVKRMSDSELDELLRRYTR